ncbi:hypothetical protein BpHYR1_049168 [Brachionus plicatilis]|uniref:Uncharacterized protein n=1 Tax=Brachionus plicatilis TaxID=10195 RepID=A0A3M7QVQ4_BRAPC|nr:hypothetical protein BpHYR1_049168 [Brachionus plicatilis]
MKLKHFNIFKKNWICRPLSRLESLVFLLGWKFRIFKTDLKILFFILTFKQSRPKQNEYMILDTAYSIFIDQI